MKQLVIDTVRYPATSKGFRQSFGVCLPYRNVDTEIIVDCIDNMLCFNGAAVESYVAEDPVILVEDEYGTRVILEHGVIITSFSEDVNGVFHKLDEQRFEGQFYGLYDRYFIAVPGKGIEPRRHVVETLEDEAYLPASYNAVLEDFNAYQALYGRRDLEYMPARAREVFGIWLMEPEHLKDPFDAILLPIETGEICDVFAFFDDIFVVSNSKTYRFTEQSGIWSLAAEFKCQVGLQGNHLNIYDLEVAFERVYHTLRVEDEKIVDGPSYPFYETSVITGPVSAVCEHDGLVYCFYANAMRAYELVSNPAVETPSAPSIAGCTAEAEELLINQQNAVQADELVDLEDLAEGYDINNGVDIFRSDFKQDFVPAYLFQLVKEKTLQGDFVGYLAAEYVLLSRSGVAVIVDFKTSEEYVIPADECVEWQLSGSELQLFTERAISSPFSSLRFVYRHFAHGIRTESVTSAFEAFGAQLRYYAAADYGAQSLVTRVDDALECAGYLIVISGAILTVYAGNAVVFTQLVESGMKIIDFDGMYTLRLFSTRSHYLETRRISVLMHRHLLGLLGRSAFDEFIEMLPASRYSLGAFTRDFPMLAHTAAAMTAQQLRQVAELAVIHPADEFEQCTAETDFALYRDYLKLAHNIDLFDMRNSVQHTPIAQEWHLPIIQVAAFAGMAFAHENYPKNDYARHLIVRNVVFAFRHLPAFEDLALRFMDSTEYAEVTRLTQNAASLAKKAMTGVVLEPFTLTKGDFQNAVGEYALALVDGALPLDDIEVIEFYENSCNADRALLRLFIASKHSPATLHMLQEQFPDFCISRNLNGERFQLTTERPTAKFPDYVGDLAKYIENKSLKAGSSFDPESDAQVKRYRCLISKENAQKSELDAQIREWELQNHEALLVQEFCESERLI